METKAITEGAIMAAITVVLGLTGVYIPLLNAIVMLVWTLPVVFVCIRHGMRAGTVTIAVAGAVIMSLTSPITAFDMMLRSAGPALLIGCGFHYSWRTEKTVFFASLATFGGLLVDLGITVFVMGISVRDMFFGNEEMLDEMVGMFTDMGLLTSMNMTPEEMAAQASEVSSTLFLMIPAMLLVYSLFSAITNYLAAHLVLRKLKAPLPPITRLSTFRMPVSLVFGFIVGFGLTVLGESFFPDIPMVVTVGQNIYVVFLTLYIIQGLGLLYFMIGKAPPSVQGVLKFSVIAIIVVTMFNALVMIGYAGVADALFDFRKLEFVSDRDRRGNTDG